MHNFNASASYGLHSTFYKKEKNALEEVTLPEDGIDIWQLLRTVDTPTVCNAIEIVNGKRQLDGFTRKANITCANPDYQPVVGFALTAIIATSREVEYNEEVRSRKRDYYRYMAQNGRTIPQHLQYLTEFTAPFVSVVEDRDVPSHAVGAFWGEVNVAIHWGMRMAGTLTNGYIRDLDVLQKGYQVIAGGVSPSHGFAEVREIDCPVRLFGLDIKPYDIIHADRHGAVKIEPEVFLKLPKAIKAVAQREKATIDAAKKHPFDVDEVLKTMGL